MTDPFATALAETAAAVEAVLDSLLTASPLAGEAARPARLVEAMRYAVLGGGKRLRPFLLVESGRLFGATGPGVLRAAAAIELVHCYSLAHDDLPAMDDDDVRRGRPSLHRAFDEATAILAGDALLTMAFEVLADPATHADAAIRAALVTGLARAAGAGGMVGGQVLDIAAMAGPEVTAIRALQAMKTGALFRFACEAGAIISGVTTEDRARLADFGRLFGAAFQIADDIADAAEEGDGPNLARLLGEDPARSELAALATAAVLILESYGPAAANLRATVRRIAGG